MAGGSVIEHQDGAVCAPDARSDAALVAAINSGELEAFTVLYYRHRDWVVAQACHFTGHPDLALDVLQETFLYFLKKFPGFQLTAQLKTFLYPAVRNYSIAARRKAARDRLSNPEELDAIPAPPTSPSTAEGNDALADVLALLPEENQAVVRLRFVDGLKLEEIARAMSVPVGTVKSRLHYALQTLRQDPRTKNFFEL